MANFIMGIISITIGVVVLSNVFITAVKGANQSYTCANSTGHMAASCSWSAGEIALWGLLTLVGIAGLLYGVLNIFGLA